MKELEAYGIMPPGVDWRRRFSGSRDMREWCEQNDALIMDWRWVLRPPPEPDADD